MPARGPLDFGWDPVFQPDEGGGAMRALGLWPSSIAIDPSYDRCRGHQVSIVRSRYRGRQHRMHYSAPGSPIRRCAAAGKTYAEQSKDEKNVISHRGAPTSRSARCRGLFDIQIVSGACVAVLLNHCSVYCGRTQGNGQHQH